MRILRAFGVMLFGAIFLALLAAPLNVAYAGIGSGITNITIGTLNPASPFAYGPSSVQATLSAVASPPNEECEITITSWAWTWSASPGSCSLSTDTNQVSTIVWNWTQNPSLPGGVNSNSITVSVVLQGTNCSGSNFTTNYTVTTNFSVTVIQITNQCVFTNPAPQSRTNIGVCEEVNLTLIGGPSTTTWSLSGAGTLSTTSGTTTLFTAPDVPNNCTITANYPGGPGLCSAITFSVVSPSAVLFVSPPLGRKHTTNVCDAGFHAQVVILPTNVSFYNIEISEMNASATATGCYSQWNGRIHQTWTQQGVGWLTPGPTNYLPIIVDYVYSGAVTPPVSSSGIFTWSIPWNYRKHGNQNDGYTFATLNQVATGSTNATCTMSKNGMSVTNALADPTINY